MCICTNNTNFLHHACLRKKKQHRPYYSYQKLIAAVMNAIRVESYTQMYAREHPRVWLSVCATHTQAPTRAHKHTHAHSHVYFCPLRCCLYCRRIYVYIKYMYTYKYTWLHVCIYIYMCIDIHICKRQDCLRCCIFCRFYRYSWRGRDGEGRIFLLVIIHTSSIRLESETHPYLWTT